ncbi:MAG: GDP-mannose 4,6-dehydratase, partial [Candidatus Omnitrophica bacterium]|nr:GDP-mannose 4,6-dehydratase [Candidatus Omnitrophota bacterium]
HTIREFLDLAFGHADLDWKQYVKVDEQFYRPAEIYELKGDYSKARRVLGWEPSVSFKELVHMMTDADLQRHQSATFR